MISKTLTQLITGVRAAVYRRAPNAQVVDTEVTDWLNEDIRELWTIVAPICRDELTVLSANLTVASGQFTLDLNALLTNPAFLAIRGIDRSVDGGVVNFRRLKPWPFPARSSIATLSYHMVGKTVRLEPALSAPGVYRVWYLPVPTPLVTGSDSIDLPFGGDKYVIQASASRIRAAMLEDPGPHLSLQAAALKIAKEYLVSHNQGDQETIIDVSDDYDPDVGDGW